MPLYIKDDAIDRLARRYQVLTKASSKTEAVRRALQMALDEELAKPLLEDIAVAFCRDLKAKAEQGSVLPNALCRAAAEDI
jgi:antitoxin VapB